MSGREGDFPRGVWKPETEFSPPLGFWIATVGLGVYICVCVLICSCAKRWLKKTSGTLLTVGTVIDILLEASGRLDSISHDTQAP